MARKKKEFRPDHQKNDILGKILLTKKQRQSVLRWGLYSLVCLFGLILQDVVMSRISIFGGTTDLVPAFIFVVCILQGGESGCIFALVASIVYYYSGSAPGAFCIPLITGISVLAAIFRQGYLRKGFSSMMLCATASVAVYEAATFAIGMFLKYTYWSRIGGFGITILATLACVPLVYPILLSIGKIGGETWKE